MNSIKLFSLLLVAFTISCNTNDDLKFSNSKTYVAETHGRFGIPGVGTTWYLGRACVVLGGSCFALGSCEPIDFPNDFPPFGTYANENGTQVEFTLLSSNEMHVEILSAPTTIEEIQEMLNATSGVNETAEAIYNTMTSSVPISTPLPLGVELSQQLQPSSTELIILPGDYPIDYSNSEHGEFVVNVEEI